MKQLINKISNHLAVVVVLLVVVLCVVFMMVGTRSDDGSITLDGSNAKYSKVQERALCELQEKEDDATLRLLGVDVPQDASSGCDPTDIAQMGTSVYYDVDVSTPSAFVAAVNGRGFNEGYGMQCVAGFKEFMYALSGKFVATKTGGASGYASQQGQIEPLGFTWHNGTSGLQDGDWAIFGGGQYGHVAMRYQGKWFGQNQGAASTTTGSAFNLLSFGTDNVIGYYRPNIYQQLVNSAVSAQNTTDPQEATIDGSYTVRRGDTLGSIALGNGWWSGIGGLYGNNGYTQRLAEKNNIPWRGLIYPNQIIVPAV